jgi:hypothetical protein
MLKELIKKLTEEQIARKHTKDLDAHKEKYGELVKSRFGDWYRVRDKWHNRAMITAALNLYHEVRGSDYRHGTSCHTVCYYAQCEKELRDRFCIAVSE